MRPRIVIHNHRTPTRDSSEELREKLGDLGTRAAFCGRELVARARNNNNTTNADIASAKEAVRLLEKVVY